MGAGRWNFDCTPPEEANAMLKIKHILFPVDFSERCLSVAPFVEAVARRYGAKITLLSAAQPFYYAAMGDPGGVVGLDADELLEGLKERLGNALTEEFKNFPVERIAELGDPSQVITDFAKANGVDLIMMATHGYGTFRSLLLGSVTAKVLHDAECPVWTAAHVAGSPNCEHIACKIILCAIDGTVNSVALMKWASALAADTGAELRLVHVVPGMGGVPSRAMDREFELDMANEARPNEARQTIGLLQDSARVKAPLNVVAGGVAERVMEEVESSGADLLVIGRGGMHETLGRLRTHTYGIIRRSACPVLSI
jgi:nucleotide-binding universal stress UspA family protein